MVCLPGGTGPRRNPLPQAGRVPRTNPCEIRPQNLTRIF